MKTTTVARGFIGAVASLLGVVAVGCSADVMDQGAAGEGEEIGVTSQALSIDNTPPALAAALRRTRVASCLLKDSAVGNNTVYMLYAGADNLAATSLSAEIMASTDGINWDEVSGINSDASKVLHAARMDMAAIQSEDLKTCAFIGGFDGANDSAEVDYVTVNAGTFSITTGADLNTARRLPEVSICKDGSNVEHIVVVGGLAGTAGIGSIEVSDDLSPGSWTLNNSGTADLNNPRGNFKLVKDGTNQRYAVAGGIDSGNRLNNVEAIVMSASCVPTVTDVTSASGLNAAQLASAVEGLQGFLKSSGATSTFNFLAGRSSTSVLPTSTNEITIDWTTFANSTKASGLPTITGAYQPLLQTAGGLVHLIGGSSANTNTGLTLVQQYNGTNSWATTTNMTEAHVTGAAGVFSGKIYVAAGSIPGTGLSTVVDEITP